MRTSVLLALLLVGCSRPSAAQQTTTCGGPANMAPVPDGGAGVPVVAYITESRGYRHDVLPHSVDVLRELSTGAFELRHFECATDVVTEQALRNVDALVFYTTGELDLTDAQKALLLRYVRDGGAFVGLHSTSDTFYNWPEWGELLGARFRAHPWHEDVGVVVQGQPHPATQPLPQPLHLTDEIYEFRDFRQDALSVVLSLDTTTVDMQANGVVVEPWGFPLAWTQTYGQGRVFYTALGHGAVWDDANYRRHVLGGIRWALGL
ncbi:MAG: ThuA domain-containing protein [Myxococcota bacterium]